MATHVRILGILHIVFGVMGLLFALVLLLIFGGVAGVVRMSDQGPDAQVAVPILAAIGTFVFFVLLILSLPGIIAGIGLLQFRPWARILTIVLSALELMSVPFGTAIDLWSLGAALEGRRGTVPRTTTSTRASMRLGEVFWRGFSDVNPSAPIHPY
jgi:hypothetical protein